MSLRDHRYLPKQANQVDSRPGSYYVSVRDADKYLLLLGPFMRHQSALQAVEVGKRMAVAYDAKAWFYSYGTCRLANGVERGKFNGLFRYNKPYN